MLHISTGRQCGYDTAVRTVLFSFLVNITFQHLVFIFDPNSGLPHPRRTATSVYVSCLYSYYNGVIYSYRDGKGHSSEFFNSQLLQYILFGSPEAHESDVSVVRRTRCSVPPPSRMKRQSTVLNGMEPGSLSVSVPPGIPNWRVLVFHKTLLEGWVPYFALHGLGGLVVSCNKLASDRHAPLDVPAKGTTRKRPPQTQLLWCSLGWSFP